MQYTLYLACYEVAWGILVHAVHPLSGMLRSGPGHNDSTINSSPMLQDDYGVSSSMLHDHYGVSSSMKGEALNNQPPKKPQRVVCIATSKICYLLKAPGFEILAPDRPLNTRANTSQMGPLRLLSSFPPHCLYSKTS
jgi:hypothetical protein